MPSRPASRHATHRGRVAGRSSSRGWWMIAALMGGAAVLFLVLWLSAEDGEAAAARPDAHRAAAPPAPVEAPAEPTPVEPASTVAPETLAQGLPGEPIARDQWWEPGRPHDYGDDPDPFIRQPLDYGSDTPEILGDRISYHVYDLERVQDMVRRGDRPGSEIAQARGGEPLTQAEREAARQVLQEFFDDTVPDIDAIIAGDLTQDEGFERIGPRRMELDRELFEALGLTAKQAEGLWPHIAERNRIRDELRD